MEILTAGETFRIILKRNKIKLSEIAKNLDQDKRTISAVLKNFDTNNGSISTLVKYAESVGFKVEFNFVPINIDEHLK